MISDKYNQIIKIILVRENGAGRYSNISISVSKLPGITLIEFNRYIELLIRIIVDIDRMYVVAGTLDELVPSHDGTLELVGDLGNTINVNLNHCTVTHDEFFAFTQRK